MHAVYTALIIVILTGSATLAGLGSSFSWGARLLVVYYTGRLMDRVGRMPIIIGGCGIAIVGTVIAGVATFLSSLLPLLTGLFLIGMGFGMVQQSRIAVSDMFPPARRGLGLGYFLTASIAGSFLATAVIALGSALFPGTSAVSMGFQWFLAVPFLVLAAIFSKAVKPDPLAIARDIKSYFTDAGELLDADAGDSVRSLKEALTPPVLVAFGASSTAAGLMIAFMVLSSIVMHTHHIIPAAISLAITLHVIGMFALSIPLGKLADTWGRNPVMALGCVLCGLGALIAPLTSEFYIITLGLFLIGVGWSAATVASTAAISDHTSPGERGKVLGANDVAVAVSALSFPFVSGFVIEAAGLFSLGLFGLLASLPAAALSVISRPSVLRGTPTLKR